MKIARVVLACILLAAIVISCNGCGDDPVQPTDPPRITAFTAAPADIMPGDSTLLTYAVTGAESLTLNPGAVALSPVTGGTVYVSPATPTEYTLTALNKGGQDTESLVISMSGAVASFDSIAADHDRILLGDSIQLSWTAARADSVVVSSDLGAVYSSVMATASLYLSPTTTTTYTAIAYGQIGHDTASFVTVVESPFAVEPVFGTLFRGSMGIGITNPAFRFRIVDQDSLPLLLPWLHFSIVEGDGYLLSDSARASGNGTIWNDYIFDGNLGHALIRATLPEVDSLEVRARASVLRFGSGGQGQLIRFEDTYADVVALNGEPDVVEEDPTRWIMYAVYENSLGVVVPIIDVNQNSQADPSEPVLEVFVNTIFSPLTPEGIGIGSTIQEVRAAYGDPDTQAVDPTPPAAEMLTYDSLGVLFFASHVAPDSAIFEIHLWEPVAPGVPSLDKTASAKLSPSDNPTYRRYRR